MSLEAGTRLGPYEILAPLGAGGMGEVYRARDPRLKRDVALKVLPAELASEPERLERFQREAETLAALNHPHIVTIFSVEEAEDFHFLTMELVEGKTLSKIIPRGGLSLPHFLRIAVPLTEAVSAAHEKGITHRDLKPGNVMVTEEDRIKVLDFGLAKLRHEAEATEDSEAPTVPATDAGRVLGTAPYMSPEQVRGKTVDHRSDVFSLGIMLYEMVTGDRPFQGDTSAELASSILRDTPASVTERNADLPRDLGKLIKHCLEKDPKRRLQSVLDVRNELEELRREVDTGEALTSAGAPITPKRADGKRRVWLVGGAFVAALALTVGYLQTRSRPEPVSAERKMLVVLPFENLGAPEDAYFAAGMTEEITSRLARVSGLGVISRTSAVQYDRTGKTTKQIGEDLGVGFVLEGTVRWDRQAEGAGRVRITPQLIRVADDTHMWADSYDRLLNDIFGIQSEIAEAVVGQLGVALLGKEQEALEVRPTEHMGAYRAYLQGLGHRPNIARKTKEEREQAAGLFERAAELDPVFVDAYARLSETHSVIYFSGQDRSPERLEEARLAAERALELQPTSPNVHRALGYYHYIQGDYERALEEYRAAGRQLPNDAELASRIALGLRRVGQFEEAVSQFEKALALDPRNDETARNLAFTFRRLHRYADADRLYELAILLAPDRRTLYVERARTALSLHGSAEQARDILAKSPVPVERESAVWVELEWWQRDYEALLKRLEESPSLEGEEWQISLQEGWLRRYMGQPKRARTAFEKALVGLEQWARDKPVAEKPYWAFASVYAGLGRNEDAIRAAKRNVEQFPISEDPWAKGPRALEIAAFTYARVGEHDAAFDEFERLLDIPSLVSVWLLRTDPDLDPLRDHPRFKKLVGEDWQAEASP